MLRQRGVKTPGPRGGAALCFETESARFWIAYENLDDVDYHYGGTRLVNSGFDEAEVELLLWRLAGYESALKNRLINNVLANSWGGGEPDWIDKYPDGFLNSKVGGGRCVIQPRSVGLFSILSNPAHPRFPEESGRILADIGEVLNRLGGLVKLTPDFGRFGMLADFMYAHTEHVLGIGVDRGGCGGKSSYSATGVAAAANVAEVGLDHARRLTLIGANGAMGQDVAARYLERQDLDVALCDVAYGSDGIRPPEGECHVLPARFGQFTEECLRRGGVIVATTVGNELVNSNWQEMPRGTTILMAHNLALPAHYAGLELARQVHEHGVVLIPGQALTLGGALTSRLEWFWRQATHQARFPKNLAHRLVGGVVQQLVSRILAAAQEMRTPPYEAMLCLSGADPRTEPRDW